MAWLIDPRRWDDAWWTGLSPYAARIWDACLTGGFRTVLPGLCKGVSVSTLYDTCAMRIRRTDRRCTVAQFEEDLAELQAPDDRGTVHFFFDPISRVARVPMAPAYNHADGPNVLTAWYRHWRDIPDCDLKFEHIESLRLGVNFAYIDKHGRPSMAEKWEATFGQPERALLDGGRRLKTYVDLQEKWVPTGTPPGTPSGTPSGRVQHTLPFGLPSGSGISDQGSGSGSGSGIKGGSVTPPVTPPETLSFPLRSHATTQNQVDHAASSNGGVDNGTGVPGFGPHSATNGEGGRTGGPTSGGGGGRRSVSPAPGTVSAPRRRMPRGLE